MATPVFATTGPDAQRALADTVVDLLGRARVPGLLGAHFHLAQDGGRVLNYAEWTDASARREFLTGGTADRLRAALGALPGVTAVPAAPVEHADPATADGPARPPVSGYQPYKTLVNVPSPRTR
ncbi:antibiotic biosynthesis monooxygenase [Streptomyces sp. A1-5]|uniref:antibiotic biosynthesis monooxygenase n=1 Tax=Streptomyces sp. A1-5 TaxID=2738410 RepID=UPI001F1D16BF|nr:antibiotic biosynthesis monooxygenase [Streptomyces sp. A1-5]